AGDDAVGDRLAGLGAPEPGEPRRGVVDIAQHARGRGDEEQPLGVHRGGELVTDEVGVDVVDAAGRVGAEAGDHGEVAGAPQRVQQRQVEAGDVADQAEIDRVGAGAGVGPGGPAGRADQVTGGAVQADRGQPGG